MKYETLINYLLASELRHQKMIVALSKPDAQYYYTKTRAEGLLVLVIESGGVWMVSHVFGKPVQDSDWQDLFQQMNLKENVLETILLPESLSQAFHASSTQRYQLVLHQGLWRLDLADLILPTTPGTLVQATEEHAAWIAEALQGFLREALPYQSWPDRDLQQDALRRIAAGNLYLWCISDQPVAMAAKVRETDSVAAISLVFTDPLHRGKGFAAAVTAAVSQHLFQTFRQCCLFTDLANPISGHLYQKIGYQQLDRFCLLKPKDSGLGGLM